MSKSSTELEHALRTIRELNLMEVESQLTRFDPNSEAHVVVTLTKFALDDKSQTGARIVKRVKGLGTGKTVQLAEDDALVRAYRMFGFNEEPPLTLLK